VIEQTIDQLISEKNLAEALGISKSSLYQLRRKGCPWVSIGGRAFYHEPSFMSWVLSHQSRCADVNQGEPPCDRGRGFSGTKDK